MKHFVYKTTNQVTGQYYIGKHSTNNMDDGYLGSGYNLIQAINKHGRKQFTREILEYAKTETEAYKLEAEYLKDVRNKPNSYNISPGQYKSAVRTLKERKTTKITKSQLVDKLSEDTTIDRLQCDFMVDRFLDMVKQYVLDGKEVELKGLGRFEHIQKSVKTSNMTGKIMPAHNQLRFKIAERLGRIIRVESREY